MIQTTPSLVANRLESNPNYLQKEMIYSGLFRFDFLNLN